MTINQIYIKGKLILKEAGNENPAFDCMCILQHCFSINRHYLIMNGNTEADRDKEKNFFNFISKRAKGYPLQYLLGEWEFMGLKFIVGEGVLIPREDTEALVNECLMHISKKEKPEVLDLCAGSGAIGISIASLKKDSYVTCVEYSDDAFEYLKKNVINNNVDNVSCIKGDIFKDISSLKNKKFDAIVSNPPYIKTSEIDSLQVEVRYEPHIALDGGEDGLSFYRVISQKWVKEYLKIGGLVAVEIGMGQGGDVKKIFEDAKLSNIQLANDIHGIKRVVYAVKTE